MTLIFNNGNCEKIVHIYGTRNDKNGFPMFLIYYNNQWAWKSAKHFKPYVIEPEFKCCENCTNNTDNYQAHTCDQCTSLDNEEDFYMWEIIK